MKSKNNFLGSNKTYFIAEGCDNHLGSFDMARGLVDAAVYAGADAIKFQHHLPDEEMLEDTPLSDNMEESLFDFLKRNSLSLEDHFKLKEYCDRVGITYLCTPFSLKAAREVKDIVPFFKIGSGEFQDRWYIDGLSEIGKPVIFSSGMASWEEIIENIEYLKTKFEKFAVLNCLSEYPPIYEDLNLGVIKKLRGEFPDLIIGHSDHTPSIESSLAAVVLGAQIIEKHLTFSKFVPGPDKSVSIDPEQFRELVKFSRNIEKSLGDEKKIQEREVQIRNWAYRSIVLNRDFKKGEIIKLEDLKTKRPGIGIPSKNYKSIIGKSINKDISANSILTYNDLND